MTVPLTILLRSIPFSVLYGIIVQDFLNLEDLARFQVAVMNDNIFEVFF